MKRLLVAYRLWNRPCNRQLTQLDGNLSYLIDAAIDSLRVLVDELGEHPKPSCICNLALAIPDDFSFLGVATRLWPIGLWNPQEIVSVTVNLNSVDTSRYFADAISAPKSV